MPEIEQPGHSLRIKRRYTVTVRGINVKSLLFAGFTAGYIMFFVDKWFAGFLGLFGSFPGTSNPWWMLEHHIESIIFALLFAWPVIYKFLPGPGWFKGMIFGIGWDFALMITTVVAGALGATIFKAFHITIIVFINELLLHIVWGFFLGALYTPPQQERVLVESRG